MIEFEYLEIVFKSKNVVDVQHTIAECEDMMEMRRYLATRGYVLRCQVNAKMIQSYSILERVIIKEEGL